MEMHVGRQTHRPHAVPQAKSSMRIVIAGNDMPGDARKSAHALQGLQQRLLRRRFGIVKVAGDQHVVGCFLRRKPADGFNGGEPRLPQHHFLFAEIAERLADLPVGRVNELHG